MSFLDEIKSMSRKSATEKVEKAKKEAKEAARLQKDNRRRERERGLSEVPKILENIKTIIKTMVADGLSEANIYWDYKYYSTDVSYTEAIDILIETEGLYLKKKVVT